MTAQHLPLRQAPKRILILYNPLVARSAALAAEIHAYLAGNAELTLSQAALTEAETGDGIAGQDLIVLLGGDGSMLRTGTLAARHGVPILGINLGRLGFLGEAQPAEWRAVVARVLTGDCWVEDRMMLHVEHHRGGQMLGSYEALNEAVIGRGALARPVRLKTLIDGFELTTYVADGLIVATPTGSTAYALAAGGPVLPPEMRNILLIAIAPHLSIDRAIVLPQGCTVDVIVRSDHQAILSADGQYEVPLQDGDQVSVCMSAFVTYFVRVRPRHYFYTSLVQRMQQNPSAGKAK